LWVGTPRGGGKIVPQLNIIVTPVFKLKGRTLGKRETIRRKKKGRKKGRGRGQDST